MNADSNFLTTGSRRKFLQTSAALAGGVLAAELPLARSAHAAGDGRIRIGLVGCGGRGTAAALNAMNAGKDVRLVAMADLFMDHLQGSLQRLKAAKPEQVEVREAQCFAGFEAYKQLLEAGVDVVLITPASCFIPQIFAAAIAAGKHVFCEKPHGIDVPGVKSVMGTCEEARRRKLNVVSGLCWRYDLGVRETMKRIHDGVIGDLVAIQETYVGPPYIVKERKPEWGEMEWQLRNWYHFNYLSGDQTAQQLIHSLDKASWAMRDQPPLKVWGMGGRQVCLEPKFGDQFDHQSVIFEYASGTRLFGFTRDMPECFNNTSDFLIGTKGRCNLLSYRIEGETNWRFEGNRGNMYDQEHAELFAAIRGGTVINNGNYMCLSTLLAVVAQIACYTGDFIIWDEALNSKRVLTPPGLSFQSEPPVKPGADGLYPAPKPGRAEYGKWLIG